MKKWLILFILLASPVQAGYEFPDFPAVIYTTASGASPVIDWSQGPVQQVTLTALTVTFTFLPPVRHERLTLILVQDATGLRAVILPTVVKCPAGLCTAITTTALKATIYEFIYDGLNYWNVGTTLNL